MADKTLFLLDAYALAYRSYYAFVKNPRMNSKGENTSAIFGFTNTLLEIVQKQKPTHLAVVFDPKGGTFRHEMYPEYKANREAMPEDLRYAIPFIKAMIEAMNIPVIEVAGYEADDVIGTLAHKAEKEGFEVFMMTPDKDYAQLVTDNVKVYKPAKFGNPPEVWTPEKVEEKFKVPPHKIIELLGLMGDTADNIPGCPGIGPKTAEKLIVKYGSIEGIYDNINDLKGKQKENLENNKEQVMLSKKLVIIETQVPVEFSESETLLEKADKEKVLALCDRLEFRNLVSRIFPEEKAAPKAPVQTSLFGDEPVVDEPVMEEVVSLKTYKDTEPTYVLVEGIDEAKKLAGQLQNEPTICFDTETTSLSTIDAALVGMAFSTGKGKAWFVSVPEGEAEAKTIVDVFANLFAREEVLWVGQNLKYDISVMKNYGVEFVGQLFDTMIAHYLIQPDGRHNLDLLAEKYLNYKTIKTEELIGKKGKKQLSMRQVEMQLLTDYACEDADITLQLMEPLKAALEKEGMFKLYNEIEIPLINVLADMERYGVTLDSGSLKLYAQELEKEIERIQSSIFSHAETEFNIASPKQLGEVLFEKMKIISNPKKTKTQQYATGEEVLLKLKDKHPIIEDILEYRGLTKLLSTYVLALPELINKKTGRIHTSYNQTVAATGRLSSTNPNLQNIPIRDARGKEIRKAFIPSSEEHVLLAVDYSQIELRLMAHFCGDKHMIEAFVNNEDIHSATAARIFSIEQADVTREQRSFAKGANFGIIYGISAFGLSQNLNIKRSEAKAIIDSYFESYPGIKDFMDQSVNNAREKGFAETLLGRKRYLSDINSQNAIVRGAAERNAINAPIQGTAADIIKLAMIDVHEKLKGQKLQSAMIMQVHDELVFDVYKPELEQVQQLVIEAMENAVQVAVPLTAEGGVGQNWLEAH
jgi:DNA polymerase-1